MHIQTTNMPWFIDQNIINNWIKEFYFFASYKLNLTFTPFDKDMILVFSDEKPKPSKYVSPISLSELKKEIETLLGKKLPIVQKANSIHEIKIHLEEIVVKIRDIFPNIEEDIYSKLHDLIRNACDDETIIYIAGLYEDEPKRITLYNKVIQMEDSSEASVDKYYSVFIHEMFHALHYHISAKKNQLEIFERADYTSTIVKESLASYFQNEFSISKKLNVSVSRSWYMNILSSPYSGANYINDWLHFNNILTHSLSDMDKALRILFKNYIDYFYIVKNSVTIVKKNVSTPKTITRTPKDYSKYEFNGVEYTKSELVLAVVKQYVSDYNPADINVLQTAFPDTLKTPYGVVKVLKSIPNKYLNPRIRFYINDTMTLADGTICAVCNQWCKNTIQNFIKTAKQHGYVIKKV